jgi:RNA polymerase sigma-70 factor, ECF subfamily
MQNGEPIGCVHGLTLGMNADSGQHATEGPNDARRTESAPLASGEIGTQIDDDALLLGRFVRGDNGGLAHLAARYERPLLGLALGIVGDRDDAMDVVQDAWVRVMRGAKKFEGRSAVRTWLYRIVINLSMDARKRRMRWWLGVRAPKPEAIEVAAEREVAHAMSVLSEEQRVLVLLCFHRGLTHVQAADVLGVPVGTLKSRMHAAMELLRGAMKSVDAEAMEDAGKTRSGVGLSGTGLSRTGLSGEEVTQ